MITMSEQPRVDRRKCERDASGWRIPRAGTVSRKIYDLMQKGFQQGDIHSKLSRSMSKSTLGVLMWKIRHPKDANEAIYRWNANVD